MTPGPTSLLWWPEIPGSPWLDHSFRHPEGRVPGLSLQIIQPLASKSHKELHTRVEVRAVLHISESEL